MDWRDELYSLIPYLEKITRKNLGAEHKHAEDVVGRAILKCLKTGYDSTKGASVKTWATNMAKWTVMHWRRERSAYTRSGKARIVESFMSDLADSEGKERDWSESIDYAQSVLAGVEADALWLAVDTCLPERNARIIKSYASGMKILEIAEELKMSGSRVYQLWESSLKILNQYLKKEEFAFERHDQHLRTVLVTPPVLEKKPKTRVVTKRKDGPCVRVKRGAYGPRNKNRDWEGIRIAVESGEGLRETGRRFGVGHNILARRAKVDGWQVPLVRRYVRSRLKGDYSRKFTNEQWATAKRLWQSGASIREAGEAIGACQSTAFKTSKRQKWKRPSGVETQQRTWRPPSGWIGATVVKFIAYHRHRRSEEFFVDRLGVKKKSDCNIARMVFANVIDEASMIDCDTLRDRLIDKWFRENREKFSRLYNDGATSNSKS